MFWPFLPGSFAQHCEPPTHRLRINSANADTSITHQAESPSVCCEMCAQHAPLLLLRKSCAQATVSPHGGIHTAIAFQCTGLNRVSNELQCDGAFEAQAPRVLQARSSNPVPQRGQTSWPCVCREATGLLPHVREITALWHLLANTSASSFPFQCIQPLWLLCFSGSATWTETLLMLSWQSVWAKFVAILRHAPAAAS